MKMKKINKNYKVILIFILLLFFIFKIVNSFATERAITINKAEISENSKTTVIDNYEYDKIAINSHVTFYEVGDFVKYKVELKNDDSINYIIKSITDNNQNKYISYDYSNYQDEKIEANGTKTFDITIKYLNEIQNIEEREQNTDVDINIILEDEEGNVKEENIFIKNNPQTGDNVVIYMAGAISSFVILLFLLKRNKVQKINNKNNYKTGKHSKGTKLFGFIILTLIIMPTIVKASNNAITINLKNNFSLKDKLIVTYNVEGEIKQKILKYNTILEIPEDVIIDGYDFKGWYTSPTGGEKITENTVLTEDITYYARLEPIIYNITYNLNGGEATNPTTYTVEDEIILNNPEKEGYTFSGWTGSNGTGLQTKVTINKGEIGDKEYTANYSANTNTKYKVIHKQMKLDGQGYETKDTEELEGATDTVVTPETKDYEGFTAPEQQELTITPDGKVELVYEYIRNKYTLTLENTEYIDLDNSTSAGKYYYGTKIKLIAKNKTGYIFSGWSNGKIRQETEFNMEGNTIVKPMYEPDTYKIVFDNNGGTGEMAEQTFTYDELQKLSKCEFTKQGYTFSSWNTEANGRGTSYDDEENVENLVAGGVITLYAQYTPNTNTPYTVIHEQMNLDGQTYTIKETQNLEGTTDTVVTPETKDYEGFTAPEQQELTITSDGNATLTYQYVRNKYTLTVEDSEHIDETSSQAGEYYYGTTLNFKVIQGEGEVFKSWNNGNANKQISFKITEDITIKPIFYDIGYFTNYNGQTDGLFGFTKSTITSFSRASSDLTLADVQSKAGYRKISNVSNDSYNSRKDIYGWVEDGKFYWWSDADFVYFHPDTEKGFYDFSNITSIDFTDVKTEKVKRFSSWFANDQKLTDIIGKINTNGQILESSEDSYFINDTSANNSSGLGFAFMFNECRNLKAIDLSEFNTSNVIDMKRMFSNCSSLTSLDLSGFDTRNVRSFYWMFRQVKLTNIDLSSFDTSNAINMLGMFVESSPIQKITLGSNFNTSNVRRMTNMFYGLSNMTTIYAEIDFDRNNLIDATNMFNNCRNLVGGAGTSYQTTFSLKDSTYAQIANENQSGYFTKK